MVRIATIILFVLITCSSPLFAQDRLEIKTADTNARSATPLLKTDAIFVDVGQSISYEPGISFTYTLKHKRYFALGFGGQAYVFAAPPNWQKHSGQFQRIPALFADVRGYRSYRKHSMMYFFDLGIDFYKAPRYKDFHQLHDGGIYNGWGIGYFHQVSKRGLAVYSTLKLIGNFVVSEHNISTNPGLSRFVEYDGGFVISVGMKF